MQVLLLRAGALGDVLLLRRAVFALRRAGHRVSLLAPQVGRALVGGGLSEAEEIRPWDGPDVARWLAGETVDASAVVAGLRAADAVVAYTRASAVLAALRPVARRLLAHDPAPPPSGPHAGSWLVEPLRELDAGIARSMAEASPDPPPLLFSSGERADAARLLERLPPRFLALHPGSGSAAKNWPAARFAALADRLAGPAPVLLALGPAEEAIGEALMRVRAGSWVVARELPARTLGAALSQAGLFVGNDSGASHLAAAAGAPTLALFGPTDPALWAPVGAFVRTLRASTGRVEDLPLDAVARAAQAAGAR